MKLVNKNTDENFAVWEKFCIFNSTAQHSTAQHSTAQHNYNYN